MFVYMISETGRSSLRSWWGMSLGMRLVSEVNYELKIFLGSMPTDPPPILSISPYTKISPFIKHLIHVHVIQVYYHTLKFHPPLPLRI